MRDRRTGATPSGLEFRTIRGGLVGEDGEGRMHGKAAPFNSETMIGKAPWGFKESLRQGSWAKSINDGDIVLLDQHDQAKPIARVSAGTLHVEERGDGAYWDAEPVDTTYARDAQANVRAKNYGGCSFGFEVIRDRWTDDEGNEADKYSGTRRELIEIKVHEISTVTFPAYLDTSVGTRSAILDERAERADKPYGNVPYADPKNGKYPIDTKAHVKAAWSYINMPKNAAKYPLNGVSLSSVKAKIKAAAKKLGVEISDRSALDWADYREMFTDDFYERADMTVDADPDDGTGESDTKTCPTCGGSGQVPAGSDDDGDDDGTGGPGSNASDMNKTTNGGAGRSADNGPDLSTRDDEARQDALRLAKLRELSR